MSPVGTIFVPFPPKTGGKLLHPRPPPIVERVGWIRQGVQHLILHRLSSLHTITVTRNSPREPTNDSEFVFQA